MDAFYSSDEYWKTRMCEHEYEGGKGKGKGKLGEGTCPRGEKCPYAHKDSEGATLTVSRGTANFQYSGWDSALTPP